MKITMPNWHADARRLREQGHGLGRIVLFLKDAGIHVSELRVSQVTNVNWQDYIEKDRVRATAIREEVGAAKREGRPPDTKKAVQKAVTHWIKEKQEMSDRGFEPVTSPDPTDTRHRVRIDCSHDGCDNHLIFAKQGVINPTHAAKWFRDKGWQVGGKPRQDLCPEHHAKSNKPHANGGPDIHTKHTEINDVPAPDASVVPGQAQKELVHLMKTGVRLDPPAPEEPVVSDRIMTKADKRIVFNKLEEVYVDEFIGYRTEWSDQKVSLDLGCPLAWVAVVREENFGPEITVTRKKADLIKLGDEIMAKAGELRDTMIPGITATIQTYDGLVAEIDEKLDAFEKMHAELTASLLDFNTKLEVLKA